MLEWLNLEEGERILDVACGAGELSLRIAARGCWVDGIDISKSAVEFARRLSGRAKIPCEFEVGDAENLPYPDGYFDKVVCSSSLEHFEDDRRALAEMQRVLRSGGKLVLTVDSFTCPISKELKDRHRQTCSVVHYYTREGLADRFGRAGLKMGRSQYLLNSPLASLCFKLWIKHRPPTVLWLAISVFGYPVFLISEKWFGQRDGGYTLIAEASRIG